MIDVKAILCPVDFSDVSRHALAHAVQLARWFQSELTVLHVYLMPAPASTVWFAGVPDPNRAVDIHEAITVAPEYAHREVQAELARFVASVDATGVDVEVRARMGRLPNGILEEANALQSGMVVLGTHGHSGFKRWAIGSVAEKVLRRARCPVLTVPPPVTEPPIDTAQMFKRILVAIDFSDTSLRGLEYGLSLARDADADLIVTHVIEGIPDPPDWKHPRIPAVVEYLRLAEDEATRRLCAALPSDAEHWCRPRIVVTSGRPYLEIVRIAREHHARLIAMGAHGSNPIDQLLFGSTTNHVIRAAPCPVLTVRD